MRTLVAHFRVRVIQTLGDQARDGLESAALHEHFTQEYRRRAAVPATGWHLEGEGRRIVLLHEPERIRVELLEAAEAGQLLGSARSSHELQHLDVRLQPRPAGKACFARQHGLGMGKLQAAWAPSEMRVPTCECLRISS